MQIGAVFNQLMNSALTKPLSVKENLSKNNKIIPSQIEQHLKILTDYHKKNSIELPQVYIDLYARFLEAGNPLEP